MTWGYGKCTHIPHAGGNQFTQDAERGGIGSGGEIERHDFYRGLEYAELKNGARSAEDPMADKFFNSKSTVDMLIACQTQLHYRL